jgi:hypothetical protein
MATTGQQAGYKDQALRGRWRMPNVGPWRRRLVLSVAIVSAVYLGFAVVAHIVDPRWPPLAFGGVRTGVRILTWPGGWIGAVLVVSHMNPFPRGWTYFSIWAWSVSAYIVLVFAVLTVGARIRTGADARE